MLIRDPVHGDITLTEAEARVLDTPEMQRLRGIKQTGTAYLVYPGCVHTRFDHSLGTLCMARRIMARLKEGGLDVGPEQEQAVALAALVHDVTHVPFGHTLEDERSLFPRHDRGDRLERLLADRLGEVLDALGQLDPVRCILRQKGVTGEKGAAGDAALGVGIDPWMTQVVSSTVDADLLDYLRRDSYFAGLAHDYDDRIFRYFDIEGASLVLNLAKNNMERPDARSEVLQLLRTRYFLTERVYFHHTKVCTGAMIAKAVEMATDQGLKEDDLLWLNDFTLIELLKGNLGRRFDPGIRALIARVENRALLKRGYVVSAAGVDPDRRRELVGRFHADRGARRDLESELARHLRIGPEGVVLYCPGLSLMKEAAAVVRTPAGIRRLNESQEGDATEIKALEAQYEALWRLYVFVPAGHQTECARAASRLLGLPNEHVAGW